MAPGIPTFDSDSLKIVPLDAKVDVDVYIYILIHNVTCYTTNNRDKKLSKVSKTFLEQTDVAKTLPT